MLRNALVASLFRGRSHAHINYLALQGSARNNLAQQSIRMDNARLTSDTMLRAIILLKDRHGGTPTPPLPSFRQDATTFQRTRRFLELMLFLDNIPNKVFLSENLTFPFTNVISHIMDIARLGERVEVPNVNDCGPAMQALSEKQRRYVAALGVFGNNQTLAYQWAYGNDNPNSAQVSSSRLGQQDKIKAAIHEHYLDKRTRIMPAMITDSLLELLGPTNTDDKARLKAIQLAIDIVPGMKAAVQMELTVNHKLSLPELEAKARRLQEQLALPQLSEQPVIEAEYEEVVIDDLADIL